MTTANKLTLARVALIPVFLVILYLDFPYARCAAFGVFVVACLTDFVDGYIARHYNQVTNFGKFMDPLADKVLVMAAMCYLVEIGQMPGWCGPARSKRPRPWSASARCCSTFSARTRGSIPCAMPSSC